MSGHTPTPWRVSSSDPKAIRRNARFIAASERETDTQFIVRAANCHDDLVAALKLARTVVELKHTAEVLPLIDAALAKAAQS